MGRMKVTGLEEFQTALEKLGNSAEQVARMALYEGVKITKDEILREIDALPVDRGRYLKNGEKFEVITRTDKEDLKQALGIANFETTSKGTTTSISFVGYGSVPTTKYPRGRPMLMLARSIEIGSSVRGKNAFVRRAVNSTKERAVQAMGETVKKAIDDIMK